MNKLLFIFASGLFATSAVYAVNGSADATAPTAMSSWGDITGKDVVYHGTGKSTNVMTDTYVSVDKDVSIKKFKVSGSGGHHSNLNLIFDGTELTQTDSTPFDYNNTPKDLNGDEIDDAITSYSTGFYYKAKETTVDGNTTYSTGTVNFTNSNVNIDLSTLDSNSNAVQQGDYGRTIYFGKGITANFTTNVQISGRNPDLKVSDSLFSVAGEMTVGGILSLTNTNFDVSGTLSTDRIRLYDGANINYDGLIQQEKDDIRADIEAVSGVSTITVGANSKAFESTRIRVAEGATLNIDTTAYGKKMRLCNATTTINGTLNITSNQGNHSVSTYIRNPTIVDGGTLTETGNKTAFMLSAYGALLTVKNSGTLRTTNGYLSVASGGIIKVEDAGSKIDSEKLVFYALDTQEKTGEIYLTSSTNLVQKSDLYVKNAGYSFELEGKLYLTKCDGVYEFGDVELLRLSSLRIDLNGASMSMGKLMVLNGNHTGGVTGSLIFEDFANGLVKVGIDESILNADGTLTSSQDNVFLSIKGYDSNGNLLTGDWSINNGYLWNSALVAVPEPAEWAMILGALALGFAIYRKRK